MGTNSGQAFPHRQNLVSLPQFPAQVRGAPGQDEGDEDAFTILAAHNVEAQAGGAPVDDDPPRLPGYVFLPEQVLGHWRIAPRGSGGHGCGVVSAQVAAVADLIVQVLGVRWGQTTGGRTRRRWAEADSSSAPTFFSLPDSGGKREVVLPEIPQWGTWGHGTCGG